MKNDWIVINDKIDRASNTPIKNVRPEKRISYLQKEKDN